MKRTPLKRASKPLDRRTPLKGAPRQRKPTREARAAEAFNLSVANLPCAQCGKVWPQVPRIEAHHVVYKQHIDAKDRWDRRNAMPLCAWCHQGHHGTHPVSAALLTDMHRAFAKQALGPYADDYVARYYAP